MDRVNPIELFAAWFDEAVAAAVPMPESMVVSTLSASGPASRVVLYRGLSEGCPRFFTNYESHKGHELAADARVALLFHWAALERQVRIEGQAEKLSGAESDEYFAARPYGHQLNAWASKQSSELADREELLARLDKFAKKYPEGQVPRPPYWGGYRVVPRAIELWQGRPDRFHERTLYERRNGSWTHHLLSP